MCIKKNKRYHHDPHRLMTLVSDVSVSAYPVLWPSFSQFYSSQKYLNLVGFFGFGLIWFGLAF